jgi:TetR/AcrR family transcriptional repressor of nem operon
MGRSKEFDRQSALKSATRVFWSKGFEGASLCDLLTAMDISRSSFYETFKSKEDLFREALASYNSESQSSVLSVQKVNAKDKTARSRLRQFFKEQTDFALNPDLPGGCFLTNTTATMTTACAEVKQTLVTRAKSRERELSNILKLAKENGELSQQHDVEGLARLLLCFNYGIMVMSRLEPQARYYQPAIDAAISLLERGERKQKKTN